MPSPLWPYWLHGHSHDANDHSFRCQFRPAGIFRLSCCLQSLLPEVPHCYPTPSRPRSSLLHGCGIATRLREEKWQKSHKSSYDFCSYEMNTTTDCQYFLPVLMVEWYHLGLVTLSWRASRLSHVIFDINWKIDNSWHPNCVLSNLCNNFVALLYHSIIILD